MTKALGHDAHGSQRCALSMVNLQPPSCETCYIHTRLTTDKNRQRVRRQLEAPTVNRRGNIALFLFSLHNICLSSTASKGFHQFSPRNGQNSILGNPLTQRMQIWHRMHTLHVGVVHDTTAHMKRRNPIPFRDFTCISVVTHPLDDFCAEEIDVHRLRRGASVVVWRWKQESAVHSVD